MPPADYLKSIFGSRRRGANNFCLLFPWPRGLLHANMFFHQTFDVWQPLKFTLWVYYFLVPRPHYSTPRIRHQSELAEKAWENAIQELGKICKSPSRSAYYSRIVEILWLSWNWFPHSHVMLIDCCVIGCGMRNPPGLKLHDVILADQ